MQFLNKLYVRSYILVHAQDAGLNISKQLVGQIRKLAETNLYKIQI